MTRGFFLMWLRKQPWTVETSIRFFSSHYAVSSVRLLDSAPVEGALNRAVTENTRTNNLGNPSSFGMS
jgi:hypothetical protein